VPKLIQKSGYFKPHENHSAAYMKYIATRDGVEKVDDRFADRPPSQKQKQLIGKLLHDYPDAKELFEYEDYLASPNIGNASEFITMALDSNWDEASSSKIYMQYIATRPRVEKRGGHGLFSDGNHVDLDTALEKLAAYDGNVWTFILSLHREDAARLGYDNAAAWRSLVKEHRSEIAEALKIPDGELHWYAAFHNESHHPHIHMMVYANHPQTGYLNTAGIHKMRSALTNTIYKQEMLNLYQQKSVSRDELVQSARSAMAQLIREIQTGVCDSPEIAARISALSEQLKNESGKMQYGYLKPRIKKQLDEIVDALERVPTVAACYESWLELQNAVQSYYTGDTPERIPLSRQKEFKQIRNMVIQEALHIVSGAFSFEDEFEQEPVPNEPPTEIPLPTDAADAEEPPPSESSSDNGSSYVDWTDDYKAALEYLYGTDASAPDFDNAFALMTAEAERGNALAMYDLAKMYASGLGCAAETTEAYAWYAKALSAFQSCEARKPWKYTEYRIGKLYAAGLGTEQDYECAADWFEMAAAQKHRYAQYSLAGLYYHGHGVEQDFEKAFDLYSASATQGFPYASYELAKMFQDGIGTAANAQKAAVHFKAAFSGFVALEKKSHNDKLQYRIGQMLLTGTGTQKNIDRATKYFEKSARLGNTFAQYQLAKLYLADETATPKKIQQALYWLEKSAEENRFAQYALGKLYRDGIHVPLNEARAVELFTRAAKQKNNYAAYALGKLYLSAGTLEKNVPGALRWLGKSAELGNQFAQYQLGKLYLAGEDLPKDVPHAVEYLTCSAEQRNQYAQYALGKLYLLGKDVPRDKKIALGWLEQSAAQGNLYAQFFLDHADDHTEPSALLSAMRLLHHLGNLFRDHSLPPGNAKGIRIDSKRRKKLHEMKIAAGHAEDEHDSEYTQIMSY